MLKAKLFLIWNSFCCYQASAYSPSNAWYLKHDIQESVDRGYTAGDFDQIHIYDKYIANWSFDEEKYRSMSDAHYVSETLLEEFIKHVLKEYPDLASLVQVPNGDEDKSSIAGKFQTVLKFRLQGNADNDRS